MGYKTKYDQSDVRFTIPAGEVLTIQSIKYDGSEYRKSDRGVSTKTTPDHKFTIVVTTETLFVLTGLAAAGESWQDAKKLLFANYDISPKGAIPYIVTLKNIEFTIKIPDVDPVEGGALYHEVTLYCEKVLVNGVDIERQKKGPGIV